MEQLINAFAWAIVHSFWQGGAIMILYLISISLVKKKDDLKFKFAFGALILLLISFGATLFSYLGEINKNESDVIQTIIYSTTIENFNNDKLTFTRLINTYSTSIFNTWILGCSLFLIKLMASFIYLMIKKNKAETINLNDYGIDFGQLKSKLGITKEVVIKLVNEHVSPFTIGILKPVIFLPFAVLNQMNEKQIECILLHELSHIKRNDYLINGITKLIEVVLFYHPLTWWWQKEMNKYREECCDYLALLHSDKMQYAKTLVALEELLSVENGAPELSLALNGRNKHLLLNRIKKMFNMPYSQISMREKLAATILIAFIAIGFNKLYAYKEASPVITPMIESFQMKNDAFPSDTIPQKQKKSTSKYTIIKKDDNKEMELQMNNGEITSFKIDGLEVPKENYAEHEKAITSMKPRDSRFRILGEGLNLDNDFDIGLSDLNNSVKKRFNMMDTSILKEDLIFEFDSMYLGQNRKLKFGRNGQIILKGIDNLEGQLEQQGKRLEDRFKNFRLDLKNYYDLDEMKFENLDDLTEFNFNDREFKLNRFDNKNRFDSLHEILRSQLREDGFLLKDQNTRVEINGKKMKVNGENQPNNIWNKYKMLIEEETGAPLDKDAKYIFNFNEKEKSINKNRRILIRS